MPFPALALVLFCLIPLIAGAKRRSVRSGPGEPGGNDYARSVLVGGIVHDYHVYIPSSYDGVRKLPLLFFFHGGFLSRASASSQAATLSRAVAAAERASRKSCQERQMSRSFWILILCAVLTPCATSQPATETAEAAVQQASDRFWATRERGDLSSLAAQVTEDAILMVPGLPDAVGRSAIRELTQQRSAAGVRTTDFKVHRREIQVIGDSAYELAWYSETHRGEDGSLQLQGRYLIVWKRESGNVWRVHRNLYSFSAAEPVDSP